MDLYQCFMCILFQESQQKELDQIRDDMMTVIQAVKSQQYDLDPDTEQLQRTVREQEEQIKRLKEGAGGDGSGNIDNVSMFVLLINKIEHANSFSAPPFVCMVVCLLVRTLDWGLWTLFSLSEQFLKRQVFAVFEPRTCFAHGTSLYCACPPPPVYLYVSPCVHFSVHMFFRTYDCLSVQAFILFRSFVRSLNPPFIFSFILSFVHSFVRLLVYSSRFFVCLYVCSCAQPLICYTFVHISFLFFSLVVWLDRTFILRRDGFTFICLSFIPSLMHSFVHSIIHSLIHSSIHPFSLMTDFLPPQ